MLLKDISSLTCPEGLSPHSIYILLLSYSRKQGIALLLLCLAPGSNLPTNALIYFQNRSGIHSLLSITKSTMWVCYLNYSKLSFGYNTLQIKCHLVRVTLWLNHGRAPSATWHPPRCLTRSPFPKISAYFFIPTTPSLPQLLLPPHPSTHTNSSLSAEASWPTGVCLAGPGDSDWADAPYPSLLCSPGHANNLPQPALHMLSKFFIFKCLS